MTYPLTNSALEDDRDAKRDILRFKRYKKEYVSTQIKLQAMTCVIIINYIFRNNLEKKDSNVIQFTKSIENELVINYWLSTKCKSIDYIGQRCSEEKICI